MQTEPWNLKTDSTREADIIPNFIIFCEDGEVEPEYFYTFAREKINITAIRNCGKQHHQVDYATEYCRKNDLLEVVEGRERLKINDGTQVWCVFDRDKELNDGKDTSFNDSIIAAESKGINTAWSNDDFELWVLLHFEEINPADPKNYHRGEYYDRLTQILSHLPPKSADEEKVTRHKMFDYYKVMKRKKRFIGITFQHMKNNIQLAVERAKILEEFHTNPKKPYHQMMPCTMVHRLVTELIRLGS